jgi:hypothetical protein
LPFKSSLVFGAYHRAHFWCETTGSNSRPLLIHEDTLLLQSLENFHRLQMRQAWLPPHKASGSFNYETYMMKMMHMMRSRL